MALNNENMRDFVDTQTKPQTKAEFASRFSSTRKAAEFLYEHSDIRNRQGDKVSVDSLMRRFQTRGGKSQGEQRAVYREAGRELPPQVKNNELTVTVRGFQGQRERTFTTTFKGGDAKAFASDPSFLTFFYQYNKNYITEGTYDMFNGGDSGALTGVTIS